MATKLRTVVSGLAVRPSVHTRAISVQTLLRTFSHLNAQQQSQQQKQETEEINEEIREWNEAHASSSEANVKADREPEVSVNQMQKISIEEVHRKHAEPSPHKGSERPEGKRENVEGTRERV